jgi:hypothetical protein
MVAGTNMIRIQAWTSFVAPKADIGKGDVMRALVLSLVAEAVDEGFEPG